MLKYILYILLFSTLLLAELKHSEKNQIVISSKNGSSYIKNQFYVCFKTGTMIKDQFFPQEDKKLMMNHSLRFYIDDSNVLHTDAGLMAIFSGKKNYSAIYKSETDSFILAPQTEKEKYLFLPTNFDGMEATVAYRCMETDNWTLAVDKNYESMLKKKNISNYNNSVKKRNEELSTEASKLKYLCNGGNFKSCMYLGFMYDDGDNIKQNKSKANKLYQKACDGGYLDACYGLGLAYYNGSGIRQNKKIAGELYKKVCNSKHLHGYSSYESCTSLGNMYYHGDGIKQSKQQASKLFSKACTNGSSNGCYNLGNMYFNGDGIIQDKIEASKLYKKACDSGSAEGCNNLALMYFYGNYLRQNKSIAKELFGKSCDGGYIEACKGYKILNEQGIQ